MSATTSTLPGTVAKELMANISRLESAIEELNHVRKDLQQNTQQVKCQINATVSRELEALRNREVWLLTQADLLQNVKEEILRGQQAQINKALGSAQKVLQYAQTDRPDLMEEVSADMSRLDMLELTDLEPEENSHISFQADAAGLRDTIMEFGRVEAGNRALQKVFADTYRPSASLPKAFEEYDDEDHHILYKTLEEVNRGKTSNSSIQVNIPKLALRPEDWLSRPTASPTGVTEAKSNKLSFPILSNNISDWLLSGSGELCKSSAGAQAHAPLTRDKSIQDWLLQIKHFPHTHDEEDDFEIVEHVTLSDASDSGMVLPSSGSGAANATPSISPSYFTQVNQSTLSTWLKDGVTSSSNSDFSDESGLFQSFRHSRSDTDGWLLNKSVCNRSCSQSPEPVEIENLFSLMCVSDKNIFTHHPDDVKTWLLQENPVSNWRVPPVGQMCKANEPCQGYGECLSSPTCSQEYLLSTQAENMWLINSTSNTDTNNQLQATFTHIKNMSNNCSDWLANGQSVNCSGTIDKGAFSKWFACMSNKYTDWLKTEESMDTDDKTTNDKQPHNCDLDLWLMKICTYEGHEKTAPMSFSAFEAFQKTLPSAAWLMKCDNAENCTKTDLEELESEKKDLMSEKAELNRWLLHGGKNLTTVSPPITTGLPIPGVTEWLIDQNVC